MNGQATRYTDGYCPTCGKQVRASDNRVLGPFDVWYHAGCLAGPAPPQTAEPLQPVENDWSGIPEDLTAPAPPAAPLEAEILRVINLLPSVTHGPITEMKDVPFAIRDLQEAYKDASRSRNAMNEKRLEAENAALREWKAAVLKVAKESDGETVTLRYKPDGESNTQKSGREPVETAKKGSFPHQYKEGQVVRWGNGVYRYVMIVSREPLHCDGGCPSYRVFDGDWRMHEYVSRFSQGGVSEEVLRPLTHEEIKGKSTE